MKPKKRLPRLDENDGYARDMVRDFLATRQQQRQEQTKHKYADVLARVKDTSNTNVPDIGTGEEVTKPHSLTAKTQAIWQRIKSAQGLTISTLEQLGSAVMPPVTPSAVPMRSSRRPGTMNINNVNKTDADNSSESQSDSETQYRTTQRMIEDLMHKQTTSPWICRLGSAQVLDEQTSESGNILIASVFYDRNHGSEADHTHLLSNEQLDEITIDNQVKACEVTHVSKVIKKEGISVRIALTPNRGKSIDSTSLALALTAEEHEENSRLRLVLSGG